MERLRKPREYSMVLAECLPCVHEHKMVLAWGCQLIQEVPEDEFEDMRQYGDWMYIDMQWHLILRKTTLEEIIEKFGGVKEIGLGPSKGFKYILFGDKKFEHKILRPVAIQMAQDCPGLVKECDKHGKEKPRIKAFSTGRPGRGGIGRRPGGLGRRKGR